MIYGDSHDHLGKAGAVVAPMDFEAMAHEILRLADDFPLRRHMGLVGYERVKTYYTYDKFIDSYRKIYEKEGQVKR